jgi:hypothetical protein
MVDIQTWIYLKLASFEFVKDHDSVTQPINISFINLPQPYMRYSMKDFQNKVTDLLKKREITKGSAEKFDALKMLFYSGQFTKFVSQMLSLDQDYFLDSVHLIIALKSMNLIATKFQM